MSADKDVSEEPEAPAVSADCWHDEGRVSLVIKQASIIEYEGELTPGLALTPMAAIKLAHTLLEYAMEAIEYENEHSSDE